MGAAGHPGCPPAGVERSPRTHLLDALLFCSRAGVVGAAAGPLGSQEMGAPYGTAASKTLLGNQGSFFNSIRAVTERISHEQGSSAG